MRHRTTAIVVTLLVGFVIALLIPVIAKIRDAAARMKCQNNLKQLGISLFSYADTFPSVRDGKEKPTLPAGTIPNPELSPEQRLSWYVAILPYVEAHPAYRQFDLKARAGDDRNRQGTSYHFQWFVCPASGEYVPNRSGTVWKSSTPLTHYVGVAGVGPDAATLPSGHPRAGVFGYDRRTALADITDGTSNTLLVIETSQNPGPWAFGGPATVRGVEPGTAPYVGPGRPFGGFHHGGWNWFRDREHSCVVAMADGSVRYLPHTIAPEVLEALATVGGKEPLPANW